MQFIRYKSFLCVLWIVQDFLYYWLGRYYLYNKTIDWVARRLWSIEEFIRSIDWATRRLWSLDWFIRSKDWVTRRLWSLDWFIWSIYWGTRRLYILSEKVQEFLYYLDNMTIAWVTRRLWSIEECIRSIDWVTRRRCQGTGQEVNKLLAYRRTKIALTVNNWVHPHQHRSDFFLQCTYVLNTSWNMGV